MRLPSKTVLRIIAAFILGLGLVYAVYALALVRPIHQARAHQAYLTEAIPIYDELHDNGIAFEYNTHTCSKIDGDQQVLMQCTYYVTGGTALTPDFIQYWPARAAKLSKILDDARWQKLPSLDPVTRNPVDNLARLLQYRGTYAANVNYRKQQGTVTCSAAFAIAPKGSSKSPSGEFQVRLACQSATGSEWF